jgi:RNase P subunit RPR2
MGVEGYCFRCRAKREMQNATETRMKNGRPAITGTCATCGTKMFKIGEAKEKPEAPQH